jgi:hypothetical protein
MDKEKFNDKCKEYGDAVTHLLKHNDGNIGKMLTDMIGVGKLRIASFEKAFRLAAIRNDELACSAEAHNPYSPDVERLRDDARKLRLAAKQL